MTRRHEHFCIRQFRRTYDRVAGKFSFDISYETRAQLTPRSLVVAEAFGLGIDEAQKFKVLNAELQICPTDIVYITGDSGSGKSVLLRAIKEDLGDEAIDLSDVEVDIDKPLIEAVGATVEDGLRLLSMVGLNDAFLFLRTYRQLSDGQRFRFRLAKFLESKKQWLLVDEFAAMLDRSTAKIVAFNLQKLVRMQGKAVIAATTHSDLLEDLSPSVYVCKRFGEEIEIKYFPNQPAVECSIIKEMKVAEGTIADWRKLSSFHYRGHRTAAPRKIFKLTRGEELCGVVVYSYPPPRCYGRKLVLPNMPMTELNKKLSVINRVVIHPKYRTIGLGAKLIHETLPLAGTPYVELIAVMPKYSPFAEKAGMQKIATQQSIDNMTQIIKTLSQLGFDLHLLGSERYLQEKIRNLTQEEIFKLKEAFMKNTHLRFRQELSGRKPFGTTSTYRQALLNADNQKIGKLIKTAGILMQAKVYLFWEKTAGNL